MCLPLSTRRQNFPNSAAVERAARLDLPDAAPLAYAVLAHGFTCLKDSKVVACIGQALALRGIATSRFDFTGRGQSSGEFVASSFADHIDGHQRCTRREVAS